MATQPDPLDGVVRVTLQQGRDLGDLERRTTDTRSEIDTAVAQAEALLRQLGAESVSRASVPECVTVVLPTERLRPWDELVADTTGIEADVDALLTGEARSATLEKLHALGEAAIAKTRMDYADCAVAGLAAILAGVVDVMLVQVPRHPGFLGSPANGGGWLSNVVKERFGELLPSASIRRLELGFPVPFDPSTSRGLDVPISGLGPRTHRFHSLGHDPLLGWIFGVSDILRGTFTAVDKDGHLICQVSPGAGTINSGLDLFEAVVEAFRRVFGHMLSDVATPAGLPAPLLPLALFVQTGTIGPHGYTIAEIARQMYRVGFDFRHFLAGSISTVLVEVIVRVSWIVRRLHEGAELPEVLPQAGHPRLRKTLLLAHSGAAAINAGKMHFVGPLGLNWAQWLALSKYAASQTAAFLTNESGNRRHAVMEQALTDDWTDLSEQIQSTWAHSGSNIRMAYV